MNIQNKLVASAWGGFLLLSGCLDSHDGMGSMDHSMSTGSAAPPVVEGSFTQALPRIQTVDGTSATLEAQVVRQASNSGSFDAMGYTSAGWLGPTLLLRTGDRLGVNLRNRLSEETNIHWHGLTAPPDQDGLPNFGTSAGGSNVFSFPVSQRAGMYWYHPHFMGSTARQAYRGLAGLIRITDAQEEGLHLPSGADEIALVVQDKRFSSGQLVYSPTSAEVMTGWMGGTVTVNGVASPVVKVRKGWVRFRILNGSNSRVFNFAMEDGREMRLIGSDGGLLSRSTGIRSLLLGPAERADLLVDYSTDRTDSATFLRSLGFANGGVQGLQAFRIMKIMVDSTIGTESTPPSDLGALQLPDVSKSSRTRVFTLNGMGAMTGMTDMEGMSGMHQINGMTWDANRIDEDVVAGQTEIWEFRNPSDEPHPVHIHGMQFSVISRSGGRASVEPFESGWKDTFLLLPGENARIVLAFPDNPGVFLLHCHNLEHEEDGMMLQFRIHPAGGPEGKALAR